ncbi:MAG: hypothetical protein F4W96_05060 [Chloroflexi bacterium]|nr:hypothetical protein [Chloroflexota bacterium]
MKLTQVIDVLNEMFARHVSDNEVLIYVSKSGPVELAPQDPRTSSEVRGPDCAARIKTLRQRPDSGAIYDQLSLLLERRVELAHQIPISNAKLDRVFDAAEECCRHLEEPGFHQQIVELRRQPMLSQFEERLQLADDRAGRLQSIVAGHERGQRISFAIISGLIDMAVLQSEGWLGRQVRAWRTATAHPAGPASWERHFRVEVEPGLHAEKSTILYLPIAPKGAA